jgi:N-methylhydantoinase B
MKLNPATFNILAHAFVSIVEEMGTSLSRSAFSFPVREGKDASTCLLDDSGQVVAQAPRVPIHMNSFGPAFEYFKKLNKVDNIQEGEVLITNDPFLGGQHTNDLIVFVPIFYKDRLVGYAASLAHHLDIGAGTPEPFAGAIDVYGEGLRLSLLRLRPQDFSGGGILEQVIQANVRTPREYIGDLNAQFAAARTGVKRLVSLMDKHGVELVRAAMNEVIDYTQRRMKHKLRALCDGIHEAEDFIDSDVFDDHPIRIHCRIEISKGDLIVDLSQSAPQVKGSINCPLSSTKSAIYSYLIAHVLKEPLFANEGTYRIVKIIAPEGSIYNPRPPAPVNARMIAAYRLYAVMNRCFAQFLPEQVKAASYDSTTQLGLALLKGDQYHVYLEVPWGGDGAWLGADGEDAISGPLSNATNIPVEALETFHTFLRVTRYELIPDSCGAGQFQGGLGLRRVFEFLEDDVLFSAYSDRFRFKPYGFFGGESPCNGKFTVLRGDEAISLTARCNFSLKKGDLVTVELGGGGGYGPPAKRSVKAIKRDLLEGRITLDFARERYAYEPATEAI